jgi:hypothetical protein
MPVAIDDSGVVTSNACSLKERLAKSRPQARIHHVATTS